MIQHFLSELRRRGVIQALTAYVVGSWVLIQVFNEIGPIFAIPTWINSLVAVASLVGFPVATYVAWFFDFSGGKLTRTPRRSDDKNAPLAPWHWAGLTLIALGAIGAGFFVFEQVHDRLIKQEQGIATADAGTSIVVLPFKDMSADNSQSFLADGIAEEIGSILGRINELDTAPMSASFRLAATGMDPVAIARQLDVATALTGSVTASGDRLRVRTELLDAARGEVLWRDSFTRTMTDVFALEADIARSISNLLLDRYLEQDELAAGTSTRSSDAYVFYLRGRAAVRERTAESVKAARKLFEQSVGLDPEFAPAHVGVAETLWRLSAGGENYGSLDPQVAGNAALGSIQRALLIDSELPEAYANLGRIEALLQNHEQALPHFDKAISLNSSLVDVFVWKYLSLNALQDYDGAMTALEKAAALDPTAPVILHNLGFEYSKRGDFDSARARFEELIELEPGNPLGYRGLADAAFRVGNLALSLEQWDRARQLSPETPLYQDSYRGVLFGLRILSRYRPLAMAAGEEMNVLLLEGRYDAIDDMMDDAIALTPDDPWLAFEAAWYRYLAGDHDKAGRLLLDADPMFSDEDRFAMPMCSPGMELALAYRESGDESRALTYLNRCSEKLDAARDGVFADSFLDHLAARIAAFNGDGPAAVREMRNALANGWLEWWTARDPLFAGLRSDGEMAAIFARIDAELDRQRALVTD